MTGLSSGGRILDTCRQPLLELSYKVQGGDFASGGEAATRMKRALKQIGIDPDITRRAAIVAYEAEMNIIIHAVAGNLMLRVTPDQIEIIARDEGPGIRDINLAMQEGYSTASEQIREMGFGAGMGLPNMKKFSDELLIESEVGKGTEVIARIHY
ncbi:MAG: anti-sigma regulatory factor [Firmicutes bacterium]|nr:anti-sigma regulatory factor [Bacillota bacterium]